MKHRRRKDGFSLRDHRVARRPETEDLRAEHPSYFRQPETLL